jgi:hypothetical protein
LIFKLGINLILAVILNIFAGVTLFVVVVELPLGGIAHAARHNKTDVWFFAGVEPHVSLQISFLVKLLPAIFKRAHKVFDAFVLLLVDLQSLDAAVGLRATREMAAELFDRFVGWQMVF